MPAAFCPGAAGRGKQGVRAEHIALGRLLGITRGATSPLTTRGNVPGPGTVIPYQQVRALLGGCNSRCLIPRVAHFLTREEVLCLEKKKDGRCFGARV